jgi:DNA-binding Lrp family transcriptional regulator
MEVRKRLRKLVRQGSIRVLAPLNPFSFKLSPTIVLMEMAGAEAIQNLLERFKDLSMVVYIFKAIGGYNLIALVVAEDRDTLEGTSIEKCSLRSSVGIRRSEFYPIGGIHFAPFLRIRGVPNP